MNDRLTSVLDPSALSSLIRLRGMLERATQEARLRSEISRHLALVTLDGAVEYAMRIAAHHTSRSVKPEASFHDLLNKTSEIGRDARSGWRGVVELHAARNQAQHLGILPDDEQVGPWMRAATAFVQDLVRAVFACSLDDVLLADAVRDPSLRALVADAERALNGGDSTRAFVLADEAFRGAHAQWRRRMRETSGTGTFHESIAEEENPSPDTPTGAFHHLSVQVFATDMSAYTQLLATRFHLRSGGPQPDEDESRAALLFAFEWILNWEVFEAGYPTERYAEYWQTVAPPDDGSGVAKVAWMLDAFRIPEQPGSGEQLDVYVQFANLPDHGRGLWANSFAAGLGEARRELGYDRPVTFLSLDWRGTARFRVSAKTDADSFGALIKSAVASTTRLQNEAEAGAKARADKAAALQLQFEQAIRDAGGSSEVFPGVTVEPAMTAEGQQLFVCLAPVAGAHPRELGQIAQAFRAQGAELIATSWVEGRVVFEAFALEDDALKRLAQAVRSAQETILRYRAADDRAELNRQAFSRRLLDLFGSEPPPPTQPMDAEAS